MKDHATTSVRRTRAMELFTEPGKNRSAEEVRKILKREFGMAISVGDLCKMRAGIALGPVQKEAARPPRTYVTNRPSRKVAPQPKLGPPSTAPVTPPAWFGSKLEEQLVMAEKFGKTVRILPDGTVEFV